MVREIRGEAPDSLVAAIAGRSEGNPFLVEELLAVDAAGHSAAGDAPGPPAGPARLRLGALAPGARHRGRRRAAGRGRAGRGRLGRAAERSGRRLREAVDRAMLTVELSGGRVAFRHALLGEAVADDLLPGERVRLHAALARILAERPDLASPTRAGAAAEIAHHLYEARDLPAALAASASAGDAAVAARAYPEAREQYERALDLFERVPDAGRGRRRPDPPARRGGRGELPRRRRRARGRPRAPGGRGERTRPATRRGRATSSAASSSGPS